MRLVSIVSCLACASFVACSSGSFDVSNGTTDAEVADSTSDSVSDDTAQADTQPADTSGADAPSDGDPCGSLSGAATDVFVDAAATGPSVGTAVCPFHHIAEATSLVFTGAPTDTRTIHVAAGSYAETATPVVHARVQLSGAGYSTTTITGGAGCTGAVSTEACVVEVDPGGEISGFTIKSSGGRGLQTNALTSAAGGVAHVKNVIVTGAMVPRAGIFIRGATDLGPGVTATSNGIGVHVVGDAPVRVLAPATGGVNVFESSAQAGFVVEGNATLTIEAGEFRHNGGDGLRLLGTPAMPHTIGNAFVHGNSAAGLYLSGTASAVVRASRFQGNRIGIRWVRTDGNSLDLGSDSAPGNNTIGANSGGGNNEVAGVCVESTNNMGKTNAQGNLWTDCPITSTKADSCDTVDGFHDLVWTPSWVTIPPFLGGSCTKAP